MIYAIILVPDVCVNAFGAYLRNFGEEDFVMRSFLIGYYAIAIPLSVVLGFVFDLSY